MILLRYIVLVNADCVEPKQLKVVQLPRLPKPMPQVSPQIEHLYVNKNLRRES